MAPGEYWTAINVLNPTYNTVKFRKKISITFPVKETGIEEPGVVGEFEPAKLGRHQALEIDRENILDHAKKIIKDLGVKFIKGFVIIHSPIELDVVAVYTAIGKEGSLTMHMERVLPRLG